MPGYVFQEQGPAELEIALSISLREPVTYLEIIKNGRVDQEIRFDEYAKAARPLKVRFEKSGWFLIRAAVDQGKAYRFGMTAPYYVEVGYEKRISRKAAQFFLDWVMERARQIQLDDAPQRREVLQDHRQVRDFWQELVQKANAE